MIGKPKYLIDQVSSLWFITTIELLSDSEPMTLDELRQEAALQGVELGIRADMVTRLVDLDMAVRNSQGFRLTERGRAMQDVVVRDERLFLEYLHQWHYGRALLPSAREYFTTYRLLIEAYWADPTCAPDRALSYVIRGVTEAFPEAADKTGLSRATIGKGLLLWKAIADAKVALRTDAPPQALLHALGLFGLTRGYRVGEPILLSEATRTELCRYLLLEPSALDPLVDRAVSVTRRLGEKSSLDGRSVYLLQPVIAE